MTVRPGLANLSPRLAARPLGRAAPAGRARVPTPVRADVPRPVSGLRMLGADRGSGFRDPHYLVERPDGQIVHLSRLLYVILANVDGRRDIAEIADRVSMQYRRRLTADGMRYVAAAKLRPLGLITDGSASSSSAAPQTAGRPLLGLRLRGTLFPQSAVRVIATVFSVLFLPPVIVASLVATVGVDYWLATSDALTASVRHVLLVPTAIPLVLALVLASTVLHECGHAAGCRYGGAEPGRIGVGLYLVFPAFYTDVTAAYRLERRGRLRTDLGGLYFNAVSIVLLGALYWLTGWALVPLAVLLIHLDMLQQLLPAVRVDGYFILADLIGVPDLFGRVRPVLLSLLPGRPTDPRVRELRPRARVAITCWVLAIVPLLGAGLVLATLRLPEVLRTTGRAITYQWTQVAGGVAGTLNAVLGTVLLLLPVLGLALLYGGLGRRAYSWLAANHARFVPRRRPAPAGSARTTEVTTMDGSLRSDPPVPAPSAPPPSGPVNGAPADAAPTDRAPADPEPTDGVPTVPVPTAVPEPAGSPDDPADPSMAGHQMSAADFTEATMLRPQSHPPRGGWRRAVYKASGGHLNPGPSVAEQQENELLDRVRAPIVGCRRVVVLSRKGGAGKTTTTLMLGHTFATRRGDRVVALDANPDAGSLGYRVRRESRRTVTSLLHDRLDVAAYADMRGYTSQAETRLEILASDDDPRISQALGEFDYRGVIDLLEKHYNLVLVDTGTGILDSATQGLLRRADQLVVVMPPALDGARVAAATLDWLDRHGYAPLVQSSVAVVNAVRGEGMLQLDRVEEHFARRCAATIRIPWDPALEAGGHTRLDELRPGTRTAYLELAAALADGFHLDVPHPPSDREHP